MNVKWYVCKHSLPSLFADNFISRACTCISQTPDEDYFDFGDSTSLNMQNMASAIRLTILNTLAWILKQYLDLRSIVVFVGK